MIKFQNLEDLKNFLENKNNFEKFSFPEIAFSAEKLVFSKGNPFNEKKIVIIGEAPGAQEEKNAIPFCGRCGKLLEKALVDQKIYQDQEVYFLNSVFWRPKLKKNESKRFSNRAPTQEEIFWCRPYLFEHLRLINPKKIICLGKVSFTTVQNLHQLKSQNMKISDFVEKIFDWQENPTCKVYVNFHPAYILRNEKNLYKKFSEDLGRIFFDKN